MNAVTPPRIVVLLSGFGSTLQAIQDAIAAGVLEAQVVAVGGDRATARGLARAVDARIATFAVDPDDFSERADFDAELARQIDLHTPDLVVLAGYMRILVADFVKHYCGRILNVHPSLLPKYRGLNTYARVLAAGDAQHGMSVHFVTEELDGGPVVLQAPVAVRADDDVDSLSARVKARERKLYPVAIQWFVSGRLRLADGAVTLDDQQLERAVWIDEDNGDTKTATA